ncbi:hypothetical protein JWG39_03045 [Desulforhopalus vacuolatus]|uniref:DUF3467 domain-containing protein n=1 Tax=Desulforhopalus vacuolatus TaxID=40414 RepID=UPI0019666DE3|nr:DUF3467 domain-containing protein [Desulforhopalus vacuolatus]MBM9518795.1 hypothetical protein [Desulforhopalus vacuolatus]
MKEEKALEEKKEDAAEQAQTKIRWDGSKMRSTYANVCNVSSTRRLSENALLPELLVIFKKQCS